MHRDTASSYSVTGIFMTPTIFQEQKSNSEKFNS